LGRGGDIRRVVEARAAWSSRLGVTPPTLLRMERGGPKVSMGAYATALWLIRRDGEVGNLAAPDHDQGALEMDVGKAIALGRSRAQSSAEARLRAADSADKTKQ
jgi:hypothetical protein